MGVSVFPAPSAASKTMFRTTLTSGTSWTVPAGVTYVNVTLYGGGGGGGGADNSNTRTTGFGLPGQVISSTLSTTPGASISYGIGGGGTAGAHGGGASATAGGSGGNTTFTGASTANGGNGGRNPTNAGRDGTQAGAQYNGGQEGPVGSSANGGTGGSGKIDIEYWV